MPAAPPGLLELAFKLRQLRLGHWPDRRLTQAQLAMALGRARPLASATVASWENRGSPKLPPRERMLAYAQFFATRRSVQGKEPALMPLDTFTAEEREEYQKLRDELLRLHAAAQGTSRELEVAPRSWLFADGGKVRLICAELPEQERPALASRDSPNYTELLSFADLDAMVELYAYLHEENSPPDVKFKSAPNVNYEDLSSHVIIIGGIGWNSITTRLLDLVRLPVEQRSDPAVESGEIFITKEPDGERKHLPIWSPANTSELIEDVGLIARMPNPLNSNRTLTVCNGIHSRGVLGAVRSLTDAQLRESNERYIAKHLPGNQFGILMRVLVIDGKAMTPDFNNPETVLHQWSAEVRI